MHRESRSIALRLIENMVENNRKLHREKLNKENANVAPRQRQQSSIPTLTKRTQKNDARTGSFDYAIRPDGTVLAEVLWKKRRVEGKPYKFSDESSIRNLSASLPPSQHRQLYLRSSEISMAKIESLIKSSILEYQRLTSLPAEPKPLFTASTSRIPVPVHSSQSTSFPNQQKEINNEGRQNSEESNTVRDKDQITNNHQQQPHLQKDHAPPSYYPKINSRDPLVARENTEPLSSSHNFATAADHSGIVVDPLEDDEFDDDILYNFDPDQAVSEHNNNNNSSISSSSNPVAKHNATGTASSERLDKINREHSSEASSKYKPPQVETRRSNYGDYNDTNSSNDSFVNNNNRQQHEPYSNDFYGGSSFDNNNFSNNNQRGSIDYASSTGNENNFDSQRNTSYNRDDGDNAPLCPGHGLPCRCLTANTSINMGRQFYKCSLPEGQSCEFFEWKDGAEGNWKDNQCTTATSSNMDRGQILEMNEENRRVFGHRSFRRGQKDVIEKAIQGRDAFVLMPTGYDMSNILCFIFFQFASRSRRSFGITV